MFVCCGFRGWCLDECQRGMVEHALRTWWTEAGANKSIRRAVASSIPATRQLSAMGQRVRLKASFVIPDSGRSREKRRSCAR